MAIFNPLPNDKILDWFKLKAFNKNKISVTQILIFFSHLGRKHCGKRRKCWLPAFLLFPHCFQKFLLQGRKKSGLCGKKLIVQNLSGTIKFLGVKKTDKTGCTVYTCHLPTPA